MINQYLPVAQIIVAVLLVISILLQRKEGGLGAALGGGESVNQFSTRRGIEKVIHHVTVVLVVLFFALAIARITL